MIDALKIDEFELNWRAHGEHMKITNPHLLRLLRHGFALMSADSISDRVLHLTSAHLFEPALQLSFLGVERRERVELRLQNFKLVFDDDFYCSCGWSYLLGN